MAPKALEWIDCLLWVKNLLQLQFLKLQLFPGEADLRDDGVLCIAEKIFEVGWFAGRKNDFRVGILRENKLLYENRDNDNLFSLPSLDVP